MKTLESVLKTISIEKEICASCKVEAGVEHPLKGMRVELRTLPESKSEEKYCQICIINQSKKSNPEKKKDMLLLIKKLGIPMFLISALIIMFSMSLYAQPGLPSDPAQAPIDGGLGLLAAAGGAYAYKKLKDEKSKKDLP